MELHRFRLLASPARPSRGGDPPMRCIAGDCVWVRWARHADDAGDTPRARVLRAYLADLTGLCRCPRRRFSRWA
ncbi:MAG: hypothetical protein Q7J28_02525 [Caulobacter sp.]|nr:hypothetical protein [Caulobacter sp.]